LTDCSMQVTSKTKGTLPEAMVVCLKTKTITNNATATR
jgi:hypothetical protein